MDPKACLDRAAYALALREYDDCDQALTDYRGWRSRGGFEPQDGDSTERRLRREMLAAIKNAA